LSCSKNFSSQNRTKAIVLFQERCFRLQKIYVLFWKQTSFEQLSWNNYFYRPVFLKSMAFNQFFSSSDLKLWAGADLSFTYNNCTTDICHFILRCHKQSDIKIVLTKITFENQMQEKTSHDLVHIAHMDVVLLRSGLKLSLCVSESAVQIIQSLPDYKISRIAKTMQCLTID
jgi:hypothetical protein